MRGKCPECEKRATFTRVEDLDESEEIIEGAKFLNSILDEEDENKMPEVLCDICGARVRIENID
jgi:endogenous inhibitor of DNA gyrase (YacG/DUF329 family)